MIKEQEKKVSLTVDPTQSECGQPFDDVFLNDEFVWPPDYHIRVEQRKERRRRVKLWNEEREKLRPRKTPWSELAREKRKTLASFGYTEKLWEQLSMETQQFVINKHFGKPCDV